jgi:hypothetical protein
MKRQAKIIKKRETLLVEKRTRGRPAHTHHSCDRCGVELETACRKRDHQRSCRPWRDRLPKRPKDCKYPVLKISLHLKLFQILS